MSQNLRPLQTFIARECCQLPGIRVAYAQFATAFRRWLPESDRLKWPKAAIGHALDSLGLPRGRGAGGNYFVGNLDLRASRPRYVLKERRRLLKELPA